MTTTNFELMSAVSLGGDAQSSPFKAGRLDGFAVQCVVTGDAVGTLKLQASNDAGSVPEAGEQAATGITNWTDVDGASLSVSGGDNTYVISSVDQHFRWARIVYVRDSGTGSVTARVSGKVSR